MILSIQHACDVLIVGSGAAGLSVALSLADHSQVIVLSKSNIKEGSTRYAQGGIAAVFDEENDSVDSHVQDTLIAGAGLCDEDAVRFTASNAADAMKWLIDFGMPFDRLDDKSDGEYHLTREGGHSHRRILHAADACQLVFSWVYAKNPSSGLSIDLGLPIKSTNRRMKASVQNP